MECNFKRLFGGLALIALACLLIVLVTSVETQGETLDGTVKDARWEQPVRGMNVTVMDDSMVSFDNTTTNDTGYFSFTVPDADYYLYLDGENIFTDTTIYVPNTSLAMGDILVNYTTEYPSLYTDLVRFVNDTGTPIEDVDWRIMNANGIPSGAINGYSNQSGYAYIPYAGHGYDIFNYGVKYNTYYSKMGYYPESPMGTYLQSAHIDAFRIYEDGHPNEGKRSLNSGGEYTPTSTPHTDEIMRTEINNQMTVYEYGINISSTHDGEYMTSVTLPGWYPHSITYEMKLNISVYGDGDQMTDLLYRTNVTLNESYRPINWNGFSIDFPSAIYLDPSKDIFIHVERASDDANPNQYFGIHAHSNIAPQADYDLWMDTGSSFTEYPNGTICLVVRRAPNNLTAVERHPPVLVTLHEYNEPAISWDYDWASNPIDKNGTNWSMPIETDVQYNTTFTFGADDLNHTINVEMVVWTGTPTTVTLVDTVAPSVGNTSFYINSSDYLSPDWHYPDIGTLVFTAYVENDFYAPIALTPINITLTNTPPTIVLTSIYSMDGTLTEVDTAEYDMHSTDVFYVDYSSSFDTETSVVAEAYMINYSYSEAWTYNQSVPGPSVSQPMSFSPEFITPAYNEPGSDHPEVQNVTLTLMVQDTVGAWQNTSILFHIYNDKPTLSWDVINMDDPINTPYFNDTGILYFPYGDEFYFNYSGSTNPDWDKEPTHSFITYENPSFIFPYVEDELWIDGEPQPIYRYFNNLGYIGAEHTMNVAIQDGTWQGTPYINPETVDHDPYLSSFNFTVSYKPTFTWNTQPSGSYMTGETMVWNVTASDVETTDPEVRWTFSLNDGAYTYVYVGNEAEYTLPDDGTLNVTLTVTDDEGWKAVWAESYEIDNAPPTITILEPFLANHTGYNGTYVGSFDAYTIDGFVLNATYMDIDGGTDEFYWDFGDGNTSTLMDRNYTYGDDGIYTVKLIANGSYGMTYLEFRVYAINTPPVAVPNQVTGDVVGGAIVFNASASYDTDGTIVNYTWEFGDGTISNQSVVNKSYSAIGNYVVRLTVTDDDGNHDSAQFRVVIKDAPELTIDDSEIDVTGEGGETVVTAITISVDETTSMVTMAVDPTSQIYGIPWTYTVYSPGGEVVQMGELITEEDAFPTNTSGDYTIAFETSDLESGDYQGNFLFTPTTQSGINGDTSKVEVSYAIGDQPTTIEDLIGNTYFVGLIIIVLFVIGVILIQLYRKRRYQDQMLEEQYHRMGRDQYRR